MNIIKTNKIMLYIIMAVILVNTATALGVAPSTDVVNYKTGKQTFTVTIVNNEHNDLKLVIYPQGELAQYVHIGQNVINMNADEYEKSFNYEIDLPEGLAPGTRTLEIVVLEVLEINKKLDEAKQALGATKDNSTTIAVTNSIIYQLNVNVPYPGLYEEGELHVTEGNVGDEISFIVPVYNRGTETAETYADVVIKGPTNEVIKELKTNVMNSTPTNVINLVSTWKADANQGMYYAEATVHYKDKYFVLRKTFIIGNLFIDVKSIKVNDFRLGTIAKFDVDLASKWNQEINDVYAEMSVKDSSGITMGNFKTASLDIPAVSEATVSGYWDTNGVKVGNYDVDVILHYSGKTTEKLFQTVVSLDSIKVRETALSGKATANGGQGNQYTMIMILVVVLIIINIGWFVYFFKFKKPRQKQENKLKSGEQDK